MSMRFSAWRCAASPISKVRATTPHLIKLRSSLRTVSTNSASPKDSASSPESLNVAKPSESQTSEGLSAAEIARDKVLTGSAKLMAEALVEEETVKAKEHWRERSEKEASDIPIWTGEESQKDAVLRMLVDSPANRPLRSDLVQSAEEKIKQALKKADMSPRPTYGTYSSSPVDVPVSGQTESPEPTGRFSRPLSETILAERDIPPEAFKPWMARYVARDAPGSSPSVLYGKFLSPKEKQTSKSSVSHLSLLDKPAGFNPNDPKHRKALRDQIQSEKLVGRVEGAREGALDYRVGGKGGTESHGRVHGLASLRAWDGLVEERIQQARQAGWFRNVPGRGKPIVEDPNLLHMDRTEFHLNRIMKRQGAKPPWIELQNELDSAHNNFRSNLLESYTRGLVRSLVTSPYHDNASLAALTTEDISKLRDSAWASREKAYHEEVIKSLNNTVRRMNAQAPQVARRGLVVLQNELDLMYQEAGPIVHAELAKRRNADWDKKKLGGDYRFGQEDNRGNGSGAFSGSWQLSTGQVGLVFAAVGGLTFLVQQKASAHGKSHDKHDEPQGDDRSSGTPGTVVASSPAEEESRFSPVRIIKVYIMEPIATLFRFLRLAMLFGPVILTSPMLLIGTPAASKRRRAGVVVDEGERWGAVWWFGFLVRQMEKAGPTFIKLGQWAASRADLFPASLCELMGKLHSNGHPHAFNYTKKVLEEAFEQRFDDIFDEFEHEPIGCGAIAQVYRAKLKRNLLPESFLAKRTSRSSKDGVEVEQVINTSVAVKVVHPRVEQNIRRDLAIMSIFANALNLLPGMEWLSLPEEVDVFGEMMNMQLDLRVEANNLERFINNFEHRGPGISFPRPIRTNGGNSSEAARKVLVEEFEDALPLKYFLVNGGGRYDAQIANSGLDAFLNMLLLDNWTHGDLHPGNIMIRFYKATTKDFFQHLASQIFSTPEPKDPILSTETEDIVQRLRAVHNDPTAWVAELDKLSEEGYEPELIFIDAGLVTTLDPTNRRNFLDLFQAIAEFDGYKAGHLMVERCRNPELVLDPETFALKIQHLVLRVKSTTFSLAAIKISDILTDVLKNVREHHVKLEGDFVNTVISILLLEGIGRRLKDDLDLLKSALPILRQLGRQMGTKEAISQVPKGNIWAMAKIWIYLEAREIAGSSTVTNIDDWVKFSGFD